MARRRNFLGLFLIHFFLLFRIIKGEYKMENLTVKLSNINKKYGAKDILSIENLSAYNGDRIAIIGANGQGKSTLLEIIAGTVQQDSGIVQKEIEFKLFEQIAETEELIDTDNIDWKLLNNFSVPKNKIETLSGGEETKYRLTQLLSSYSMGLLLDEPTTHLDNKSVNVLIDELKYHYGTLIFVSHNRFFINQLANKIWEIENGTVYEYGGTYDDYLEQKQMKLLEIENSNEQFIKEKKRLESAIKKKKEQAEKSSNVSNSKKNKSIRPDRLASSKQKDTVQKRQQKTAKAMESRLNQLGGMEKIYTQNEIIFPPSQTTELHNKFPIMGDNFYLKKGEKILFDKCNFQFLLGQKIAIIGNNGVGKTSLLKSILRKEEGIIVSSKVIFSTYHQMSYKVFDDESVLSYLMNQTEYQESIVRSILNNLGFSQSEVLKSVKDLSGGESTRVQIAMLFTKPSNVLILDEPTNFVDLKTIEALEKLIKAYNGTVIFTSHDPYFIKNVAEVTYKIEDYILKHI